MEENKWISVHDAMPPKEDAYLCYVKAFQTPESSFTISLQIELNFDPEKGWELPYKCSGYVKYWKLRDKNPDEE
jgi:hypothetical protein